jgi:citrate lyase subunit beta/citryl-CoA lyase
MLAKAATLPADQVFLDLEDSVAPLEKEAARANVVEALRTQDWGGKVRVVRVNATDTRFFYRDVVEVVEAAGDVMDCVMLPKVQTPGDVYMLSTLLTQIEMNQGFEIGRIGIEAQIEDAQGLINVEQIACASERIETIIFGPGDYAAAIGIPQLTVGALMPDYPGDHFHYVLSKIVVAARARGVQAIDGPYAQIRDAEGFREVARRSRMLGFDGKWSLHPGQVEILNEVYAPSEEEYRRAEDILDAYRVATEEDRRGAVMFGDEMIDEASRKMAEQVALAGRAVGYTR